MLKEVPEAEVEQLTKPVVEHPSTWEVLLRENPPVLRNQLGDFHRMFVTSMYRRVLNYHRDAKRRAVRSEPLWRLEAGPLKEYFTQHPLSSPEAEKLLDTLTQIQRDAFIRYFLQGKPLQEGARLVTAGHPLKSATYLAPHALAKRILEGLLHLPPTQWPKTDVTETARRLIKKHPDFYTTYLSSLPPRTARWITYAQLRFQEKLSNQDIAQQLDVTEGAVKVLGFRFCLALTRKAIETGLIDPSTINMGAFSFKLQPRSKEIIDQ